MKNLTLFITGLILTSLMFTSCRKDYTCTCVITDSSGGTRTNIENIKATSKNKQSVCEATTANSSFGKTCTVK